MSAPCRVWLLALAVALTPALWLPLPAHAEIRLIDDRGATLVLPHSPRRVVSLLPSLTEAVCALGACQRLVGVDRFSNWPEQVKLLPQLGGLEDAQVERIVALRPDVVLAEPSGRTIERLEALGLKVLVVDASTHADVKRSLVLLGRLLDSPAAADGAWAHIQAAFDEAAQRMPASLRGQRVYFEIDTTPYAAGASSFIGETLSRLGLANIVAPSMGAFPRLNAEFVVKARPDIIIATQGSLSSMPARPGWGALTALVRQRSCGFSPAQFELLVRPGPRMGEAAQLLSLCLVGLAEER